MSIASGLVGDLKLSDVLTFLTVQRTGSISAAARELMVTPSHVSKTIGRLEELLGVTLLSRSANGVSLLGDGLRILPQFERMLALAHTLSGQETKVRTLGFAAPSFILSFLLPRVAALST